MQRFKLFKSDYYLLAGFIICSMLIVYMVGEIIVHAR
jgi:hypothetical protein